MKVQPLKRQGFYTVFDNVLLDHVMSSLKATSWAVFCLIMRKTIGWQKESDEVSYSQIKAGTGIKSEATIRSAITELSERGLILIQTTEGKTNFYILNREFTIDIPDGRSETPSKNEGVTPTKFEGVPPQKLKTQKKGNISINNAREEQVLEEQAFPDIRSEEGYKDLQNEIIAACKKLNILALKEEDVFNIDILYASDVQPAEIREFYSRNDQSSWWASQNWKGKKGQFATTQDIVDTIEQARVFTSGDSAELALKEVQEWVRGDRSFPDFSSQVTLEVIRDMGEYELKNTNPAFWTIKFKETFAKYNPDS